MGSGNRQTEVTCGALPHNQKMGFSKNHGHSDWFISLALFRSTFHIIYELSYCRYSSILESSILKSVLNPSYYGFTIINA